MQNVRLSVHNVRLFKYNVRLFEYNVTLFANLILKHFACHTHMHIHAITHVHTQHIQVHTQERTDVPAYVRGCTHGNTNLTPGEHSDINPTQEGYTLITVL